MLLVRHARPEIERDVPPVEWRLSPTGRSQAHTLAKRLEPFGPDVICSSAEPEAMESRDDHRHGTVMALHIAAELGMDAFDVWQRLAMPCYVHLGRAGRPFPSHGARNR